MTPSTTDTSQVSAVLPNRYLSVGSSTKYASRFLDLAPMTLEWNIGSM